MRGRGSVAALLAATALAGCGGHDGVWGIKTGMRQGEVRARLGVPDTVFHAKFRDGRETCWAYPARKEGTSIVGRNFCFRRGRIAHIGTSNHL